jgi:hypothetical protein
MQTKFERASGGDLLSERVLAATLWLLSSDSSSSCILFKWVRRSVTRWKYSLVGGGD